MKRFVCAVVAALLAACVGTPEQDETVAQVTFDVVFEGNNTLPGFRLRRVIEDLLIEFARKPDRESTIHDAAQDLTDHYQSIGFPDASVDYAVERKPKLRVVFRVTEGPRVTITRMKLTGNERFDDEQLLELWQRTRSGLLGVGDAYFVLVDIAAFRLAIVERYAGAGYLAIKVEKPRLRRSADGQRVDVELVIAEGAVFKLASLEIPKSFRMPDLDVDTKRFVGKPFRGIDMRMLRQQVREQLENRGYPNPLVRVRVDVDREKHTVAARVTVDPGQQALVKEIVIEGLERTREGVVRSELHIETGTLYDGSQVESTVSGLYGTGLFRRVEIAREKLPDGALRLIVKLEELEAREVSLLAGYGSYELARAGVYYLDNNLFGTGQRLRVGGKISVRSVGADATWTEPQIFSTDTSLAVTAYTKEREEPAFTDVSSGVSAAFSRRVFAYTQARLGYSFEVSDARDVDPSIERDTTNDFRLATVFTELVHDTRDSPLYPKTGNRQFARLEYAAEELGSEVEFVRVTGGLSWFLPLADEWTLGMAVSTGVIWPGGDEALPVQERFYNGGFATVRSFRQDRLGPRAPSGNPAGGEYRNVGNLELRFPVFKALKGAVFADAGNVGSSVEDYGLSNLRYAIGGGIRLALPIGPLRFDVGWNPDARDGERDYAVHLSVGLPF